MYISEEYLELGREAVRLGKRMNLCKDGVFKAFFTMECKEAEILRNRFISAVIGKKVAVSVVINPELLPDFADGKVIRLDLLCELSNGEKVDIEMQMCSGDDNQLKRTVYYASKLCAGALKSGQKYSKLPNVYQIMICNFRLFEKDTEFNHLFTFRDETCFELSDTIQIHTIELPKINFNPKTVDSLSEVEFFGMLLKYNEDKKVISELKSSPRYKEVVAMADSMVNKICEDQYEWAKQYLLDKMEMDYYAGMACARDEGIEIGLERGLEKGLQKGLRKGLKKGLEQGLKQGVERGIKQGIEQGIKQGQTLVFSSIIKNMRQNNLTYEQIASNLGLSVEEVKNYEEN